MLTKVDRSSGGDESPCGGFGLGRTRRTEKDSKTSCIRNDLVLQLLLRFLSFPSSYFRSVVCLVTARFFVLPKRAHSLLPARGCRYSLEIPSNERDGGRGRSSQNKSVTPTSDLPPPNSKVRRRGFFLERFRVRNLRRNNPDGNVGNTQTGTLVPEPDRRRRM